MEFRIAEGVDPRALAGGLFVAKPKDLAQRVVYQFEF